MTKKIRLIDDEAGTETEATEAVESTGGAAFTKADAAVLMKYAEAIDWKLWEILKLLRANAPESDTK